MRVCRIGHSFAYQAVFVFAGVMPAGAITEQREQSVDRIPQSAFVLRHQITAWYANSAWGREQ